MRKQERAHSHSPVDDGDFGTGLRDSSAELVSYATVAAGDDDATTSSPPLSTLYSTSMPPKHLPELSMVNLLDMVVVVVCGREVIVG